MKIIILVTEDWYFWSHRLPLARALKNAGHDVVVITQVRTHGHRLIEEGFKVIPLHWRRRGPNLLGEVASLYHLIRIYLSEKPHIVHHVALKPIVYGSIAAWIARVPTAVNALAGLGYVFTSQNLRANIVRRTLIPLLRLLLGRDSSWMIVQNPDDQLIAIEEFNVHPDKIRLIRGSGVDIRRFHPVNSPQSVLTITMVSRLIQGKGVEVFALAAERVKSIYPNVKFWLVGEPDPGNPGSIPLEHIKRWQASGILEWKGKREDIPEIWAQSAIAVLPTYYGEGVPKSLLEAAACARPIIATDVPGCREVVEHDKNGLLIPERNPEALAKAITYLIEHPGIRNTMGIAGRKIAVEHFSESIIVGKTLELYSEINAHRC